jgi:hypothetical protein
VARGSQDIVGPEFIRAKMVRTAFTLESRPLSVAREGNATAGSDETDYGCAILQAGL